VTRRAAQLQNLKRYGLTEADYDMMLEVQEYSCALCHEPEEKLRADGSEMPLSVDHCHETGRVRGLLCHRCNTALGLFREDPEVLRRALEYLGHRI